MRRSIAVISLLASVLALTACLATWNSNTGPGSHAPLSPRSGPPRHRAGPLDATFLVISDTHFGGDIEEPWRGPPLGPPGKVGMLDLQRFIVRQANSMEGRDWPATFGGQVARPLGMLVAGDLTEDGDPSQWKEFESVYGGPARPALLQMPVEESSGNHDHRSGPFIAEQVARRHGGEAYSIDWGDLHVVSLGEEPNDDIVEWLRGDLAALGSDVPIVLFFHRPILGPYSAEGWFGTPSNQTAFLDAIKQHDIAAIFHGHIHKTGNYTWHGIPVYVAGSAKNDAKSFLVAHLTDDRIQIASWNYECQDFWWWEQRPRHGASNVAPVVGQHQCGDRKPTVPYPISQAQGL